MFKTSQGGVPAFGEDRGARWVLHRSAGGATKGAVGFGWLRPGAEEIVHCHPNAEQAIMVLEGQGVALTPGGQQPLVPGSVLFAPRRAWHGARAGAQTMLMLLVYAGVSDPAEAGRKGVDGAVSGEGALAWASAPRDAGLQTLHVPAEGFVNMRAAVRVSSEVGGSHRMVLGESIFDGPGSVHNLHRHPSAEEFQVILDGEGFHIGEGGVETQVGPGEVMLMPAGEWHGFRGAGTAVTRTIFGFLGVPGVDQAGYELPAWTPARMTPSGTLEGKRRD